MAHYMFKTTKTDLYILVGVLCWATTLISLNFFVANEYQEGSPISSISLRSLTASFGVMLVFLVFANGNVRSHLVTGKFFERPYPLLVSIPTAVVGFLVGLAVTLLGTLTIFQEFAGLGLGTKPLVLEFIFQAIIWGIIILGVCLAFLWTHYRVPHDSITVVDNFAYYPGEIVRLWGIRKHQFLLIKRKQLVTFPYKLGGKKIGMMTIEVEVDIEKAQQRKVRGIDPILEEAFIDELTRVANCLPPEEFLTNPVFPPSIPPREDFCCGIPFRWDGYWKNFTPM